MYRELKIMRLCNDLSVSLSHIASLPTILSLSHSIPLPLPITLSPIDTHTHTQSHTHTHIHTHTLTRTHSLSHSLTLSLSLSGVYSLVAIISHIGRNTDHGHYVCHIKKEGKWSLFNDEKVLYFTLLLLFYSYK